MLLFRCCCNLATRQFETLRDQSSMIKISIKCTLFLLLESFSSDSEMQSIEIPEMRREMSDHYVIEIEIIPREMQRERKKKKIESKLFCSQLKIFSIH